MTNQRFFKFLFVFIFFTVSIITTQSVFAQDLPIINPSQENCVYGWNTNLANRQKNDDIKKLQSFLKVTETGYFGDETYRAVVSFQEKYRDEILNPINLTEATGFVGPYTRAKIKSICKNYIFSSQNTRTQDSYFDSKSQNENKTLGLETFLQIAQATYLQKNILYFVLVLILIVFGFNFIIWGFIGFLRIIHDFFSKKRNNSASIDRTPITKEEVAVVIPAHNEEVVIADTLSSILKLVSPHNVFLISDGSVDKTAEIARSFKINVMESMPGSGKAGALEKCIKNFEIDKNFKAVIFLDADTRLKDNYLDAALPFFNDKDIVAVAGYAATIWNPKQMSWKQLLYVSHRDRIYFLTQRFLKFGQTWKHTNVTPIIPGFASIYRTSILSKINMNPKGLVIEDFNMTFEIHHNKLGKIAHHPKVVGYTQDPDNGRDYFKQVKRWQLGFWQTIKLHGFWTSKFWLSLFLQLTEVLLVSFIFILLPLSIFILSLLIIVNSYLLPNILSFVINTKFSEFYYLLWVYAIGIFAADYIVTLIVAIAQKRVQYVILGFSFPALRFLDSIAFLVSIPKAFFSTSTGRWVSPTRRKN